MPKGVPNKKNPAEFKQMVVETVRKEGLSYQEAEGKFEIGGHNCIQKWERIYLEEGAEGQSVERRGRASAAAGTRKGRPPKLDKQVEEDLITENQRLRADYLKNLNALVSKRVQREKSASDFEPKA